MLGILASFTLIVEDLKQLSMKPEAVWVNLGYPSTGSQRLISQGIHSINIRKTNVPRPDGSPLCKGMGEGHCMQPYPCIYKEVVSGFEPMTKQSTRHNFTAVLGLTLLNLPQTP